MDASATICEYYDALRAGDPLGPFFADTDGTVVKFGISERLVGTDEIRAGLREQTDTTTDWTIESDALRVTERDCHAWFSDDVGMAWTDTARGTRYEFDTRWSGTLERRDETGTPSDEADESDAPSDEPPADWQFVGMHVSTAGSL